MKTCNFWNFKYKSSKQMLFPFVILFMN